MVPPAVIAELLHEDAPLMVRDWAANLPSWMSVQESPVRGDVGMEKLQSGERAAILLAESVKADAILLDEKSGRRMAASRGLRIAGTLGVLGEATARGLVDLAAAIDRLLKTNFRYSPALLKATLDRFAK
jgi:predicted nucleic acid-binding protein